MNPSLSLTLEIQSGKVTAATISGLPGAADRRIVRSVSVDISGAPHATHADLIKKMSRALSEALDFLPESRGASRVDCILSSPWISSGSRTAGAEYTKETPVTKKSVGALIIAERAKMAQTVAGRKDLVFVEQKIFEIKINGYAMADFENKKARKLEVSFAASMTTHSVLDHIEEAVMKHVGTGMQPITYHSAALLGYIAARDMSGEGTSYVFGHIHGENSDILIVQKGIITLVASLPFGYSTLVREAAGSLGETHHGSRSKLALHSSGGLHGGEASRVSAVIDPILYDKWANEFAWLVAQDPHDPDEVARPVILSVPQEYYPHFKKSLENKQDTAHDRQNKAVEKKEDAGILHKVHVFMVNHINTDLIHGLLRL